MKEEDLSKRLDNILIDGLIKEAEQDNADFEAAMRNLSDEAFERIVEKPVEEPIVSESISQDQDDARFALAHSLPKMSKTCPERQEFRSLDIDDKWDSAPVQKSKSSRMKIFRPWIAAAVAAAAVILAVLIPGYNHMNSRLCDSALVMSQDYISASKGETDLSSATTEQIKEELPMLLQRYEESCMDGNFTSDFPGAAWDLAVAYLKLHKRSDAVKVLKKLESQTHGTPMGNHCQKLLEIL